MIIRKNVEIKDVTDSGLIIVAFATLGVIDKDGDITLPGFFGEQDAIMLPTHNWQHRPLGKGPIKEVGDKAIAEMKVNLDDPEAKNWHSWLKFDMKNGKPLQEYSYGFTIVDGGSSPGGQDASGAKALRTLRKTPAGDPGCLVHEVSPVVVGAGEGTGTLSVKAAKEGEPTGLKFCDELEAALSAIDGVVTRAGSLADLRWKEGRGLSAASKERLVKMVDRLKAVGVPIESLLSKDAEVRAAARREINRSLAIEAGI